MRASMGKKCGNEVIDEDVEKRNEGKQGGKHHPKERK